MSNDLHPCILFEFFLAFASKQLVCSLHLWISGTCMIVQVCTSVHAHFSVSVKLFRIVKDPNVHFPPQSLFKLCEHYFYWLTLLFLSSSWSVLACIMGNLPHKVCKQSRLSGSLQKEKVPVYLVNCGFGQPLALADFLGSHTLNVQVQEVWTLFSSIHQGGRVKVWAAISHCLETAKSNLLGHKHIRTNTVYLGPGPDRHVCRQFLHRDWLCSCQIAGSGYYKANVVIAPAGGRLKPGLCTLICVQGLHLLTRYCHWLQEVKPWELSEH